MATRRAARLHGLRACTFSGQRYRNVATSPFAQKSGPWPSRSPGFDTAMQRSQLCLGGSAGPHDRVALYQLVACRGRRVVEPAFSDAPCVFERTCARSPPRLPHRPLRCGGWTLLSSHAVSRLPRLTDTSMLPINVANEPSGKGNELARQLGLLRWPNITPWKHRVEQVEPRTQLAFIASDTRSEAKSCRTAAMGSMSLAHARRRATSIKLERGLEELTTAARHDAACECVAAKQARKSFFTDEPSHGRAIFPLDPGLVIPAERQRG